LKVIGFLILLFNWYMIDINGFDILNTMGVVLGILMILGQEVLSHIFLIFKDNIGDKNK
jgi:uncharacterized protein YbjQ (UPF0145 family)